MASGWPPSISIRYPRVRDATLRVPRDGLAWPAAPCDAGQVGASRRLLMDRIAAVVTAAAVPGVRLVGVDGAAGSGKSTVANELSRRFGWPVIEVDDFFSWVSFDSWWPRFETQVITPLLSGHSIRYQVRDWARDEFGEGLGGWKELDWSPVIIIEGVGSTRSDRRSARLSGVGARDRVGAIDTGCEPRR